MRINSRLLIFKAIILFIALQPEGVLAQDQTATLPDGRKVILHANMTWEYFEGISYDYDFSKLVDNEIPDFLRRGVKTNRQTLIVAVEMHLQGWEYSMPRPKSSQASWGNSDGRTTWWKGHWYNKKTRKYSRSTPKKGPSGYYTGDSQNDKGSWSNGGSPAYPSKIDWLLSSSGGIKPTR